MITNTAKRTAIRFMQPPFVVILRLRSVHVDGQRRLRGPVWYRFSEAATEGCKQRRPMKFEALLRAHGFMKTERPPEMWEATELRSGRFLAIRRHELGSTERARREITDGGSTVRLYPSHW